MKQEKKIPKKLTKNRILVFLKLRDAYIKKAHRKDAKFAKENFDKADEIQKNIMYSFRKNFDYYEVDFIIESLTRFGDAPSVMYDDNGLFAITGHGWQPVVMGKEKIEGQMTFFLEKKQWKKSIREALKYYLKK